MAMQAFPCMTAQGSVLAYAQDLAECASMLSSCDTFFMGCRSGLWMT